METLAKPIKHITIKNVTHYKTNVYVNLKCNAIIIIDLFDEDTTTHPLT